MDQDISSSSEKALFELGMRFKEAVRANQTATDMFDETLTTFLGINRTDGRCLDIIDRIGKVSAGQLAIESGLTTGAVTAVIDRLETAGYVRRIRDEIDRRKVWVETTEECRAINARIFGVYARMSPVLMSRFTPDQTRAILEFLEIGTFLSHELAAAMKEHYDPSASTVAARVIQARAFERAMEANTSRLTAEIGEVGKKYSGK